MAKKPNGKQDARAEGVSEVIGEAPKAEAKKKGGNLSAHYIAQNGQEANSMPDVPVGIMVRVGKAEDGSMGMYGERAVMFADLPEATRLRLLAFGAKTAAQNAVNTAASPFEGWEAFSRRFDNFSKDVWSEVGGGGGGVPLYLQAFKRAAEKAGRSAEAIEAKFQELLALYNDESGSEKDAAKRRKDLRTELMSKPAIEAAFLELQAEAVAKRQKALTPTATTEDQFASLGL